MSFFKSKKTKNLEADLASMDPNFRVVSTVLMDFIRIQDSKNTLTGVFKLFILMIGVAFFINIISKVPPSKIPAIQAPHVALVDVRGMIGEGAEADANLIAQGLREAMANKHAAGVLVRANSPGGSPVHSGYIYDEIKELKAEYPKKKIIFVVADTCASGCYYMAAAADKIYADKASLIGSIGVRMDGFGFTGAMDKLGVERRLLTAGESKGMLDPFSSVNPSHVAHVESMLTVIHDQFINAVKTGRGDRLTASDGDDVFSGKFWAGEQALKLGLVDGLSRPSKVALEEFGIDKFVDYTAKKNKLDQLLERFGAEAMAKALVTQLKAESVLSVR